MYGQISVENDASFDSIVHFVNSGIYKGKINVQYLNISRENHPFFGSLEHRKGSLIYQNQKYNQINMRYDIVEDEIQIFPQESINLPSITLFNELLDCFTIRNTHFVRRKDKNLKSIIYEKIITNKKFTLLKRHKKIIRKRPERKTTIYEYQEKPFELFISIENQIIPISSKGDVLKIFKMDETILLPLFKKNNQKKIPKKDRIRRTLEDWHQLILTKQH